MKFSTYSKIFSSVDDPQTLILYSTKRAATILIRKSILQNLEDGSLAPEEERTLFDLDLLVDDRENERKEMKAYVDELNSLSPVFAAKVAVNLDCNLACRYCFEGTRKGNFYMRSETADLFIEFARKIALVGKKDITLTFYGGEPLLSMKLIAHISKELLRFSNDNGLTYRAAVITNGTLLTQSAAAALKACGITQAVVTLDGPRQVHDVFRPLKSGRGSFDLIIENLKNVSGIMDIVVNGNFTRNTHPDFRVLLDYLTEIGLTGEKLSMVRFGPVTREAKEVALPDFHDGCESFNEPWFPKTELSLREEILRRGFRTYRLVPAPCSLDMKDHMLVNYDGGIYKCPGLIGREEFKVGDLRTGIAHHRQPQGRDSWKNEECLDCIYLPLCFGGCRYMKLVRDGDMNGVDCKKPYFDAVLESLVKQDIRFNLTA